MFNMLDIAQYSTEALMLAALIFVIAAFLIGYITDAVLGNRGFGPFGNGCLAILGCFVGVYARHTYFGFANGNEMVITGGLAAATATAMLLILGIIKHWVAD